MSIQDEASEFMRATDGVPPIPAVLNAACRCGSSPLIVSAQSSASISNARRVTPSW